MPNLICSHKLNWATCDCDLDGPRNTEYHSRLLYPCFLTTISSEAPQNICCSFSLFNHPLQHSSCANLQVFHSGIGSWPHSLENFKFAVFNIPRGLLVQVITLLGFFHASMQSAHSHLLGCYTLLITQDQCCLALPVSRPRILCPDPCPHSHQLSLFLQKPMDAFSTQGLFGVLHHKAEPCRQMLSISVPGASDTLLTYHPS